MKVKETAVKYRTTKKPFTYQDYLQLPDDGKRYEVINGELIMAPSPITIHQIISTSLSAGLFNYVKENELGTILTAPLDVVLNETNVYQPDIIFISRERKEIITEKNISGAPDLVIEILSPSTAYYDLFDKKEHYEKFGVKEYWIVDPMRQWIEVYQLKEGKFNLVQKLQKQGKLRSELLKGLTIDLQEIFKEH